MESDATAKITKKEIEEIECVYSKYSYTEAGQRILRLIAYVRELEGRKK